jgi:hypothetical protein
LPIAISFAPANVVKGWVERYRAAADKADWMPGPDHVLYRHLAHVARSDAAATEEMQEANAARARVAAQTPSTGAEMGGPAAQSRTPPPSFFTPYFFGGPETVIARAEEMRSAGVGILDLAFIIPGGERQAEALKTFAAKAMPALAKM